MHWDLLNGGVFDWDGTLADIDERELYCINGALKAHGFKTVSNEFYVQNYYCRPYEIGSGPRMVLKMALAQEKRAEEDVYGTYRKLFANTVERASLQDGALELLQVLRKAGLRIGIATMRYTRSTVGSELKALGVEPYVEIFLTREDLGFGRPLESLEETVEQRVKLVFRALERLGLGVWETFLVGDSWWDVRAGKELGMRTVLVSTGFASHNDFSSEKPDLTVQSLAGIGVWVLSGGM